MLIRGPIGEEAGCALLIRGPIGEEAGCALLIRGPFGEEACTVGEWRRCSVSSVVTLTGYAAKKWAQSLQTLGSISCVLVSLTPGSH